MSVKWYNVMNENGFTNRNYTSEDILVHHTTIIRNDIGKIKRSVEESETVEFSNMEEAKNRGAVNATGPGGRPVRGYSHTADRRSLRSHGFPKRGHFTPVISSRSAPENNDARLSRRKWAFRATLPSAWP